MQPTLLVAQALPERTEHDLAQAFDTHFLYRAAEPDALLRDIGDQIQAIAGFAVSASMIAHLPKLQIIANFGVGYDRVDVAEARKRGIKVTNTPDVLNDAMAEFTLGLMIGLGRKLREADAFVREGSWANGPFPLQSDLRGKTVGILGLGRIGSEIAARCQAMKMRVIYHARSRKRYSPFVYYSSLQDMARDADWLVVATPGGPDTEGLVDGPVLDALGPEGRLVNIARGSVVDEQVLINKLTDGAIAGAALDVFHNEPRIAQALRELPNTLLTPHIGSATVQTREAMGQLLIDNLVAFFSGKPLISEVG